MAAEIMSNDRVAIRINPPHRCGDKREDWKPMLDWRDGAGVAFR
jgi:hypothetical protein